MSKYCDDCNKNYSDIESHYNTELHKHRKKWQIGLFKDTLDFSLYRKINNPPDFSALPDKTVFGNNQVFGTSEHFTIP